MERAFAARHGTLLVIAHRISSARRADRILVVDGRRAVVGTQSGLRESACYRDLVGSWSPVATPTPPPHAPPVTGRS